ncbi:MAG: glycosyltransferase family 4 protein, partial [Planctomycetota bacterium]
NEVLPHIPNLLLHIVGLWEYSAADTLHKWCNEFGVANNVKYHGVQAHEKLPAFIKYADICLNTLPSGLHRDECYPLKIFTYLAMGKALISSESPAVSRLVRNNVNGLLVKPQDFEELFNAILLLYKDTGLRSSLEKRARRSVLAYDWKTITNPFIIKLKNVMLTSDNIN